MTFICPRKLGLLICITSNSAGHEKKLVSEEQFESIAPQLLVIFNVFFFCSQSHYFPLYACINSGYAWLYVGACNLDC